MGSSGEAAENDHHPTRLFLSRRCCCCWWWWWLVGWLVGFVLHISVLKKNEEEYEVLGRISCRRPRARARNRALLLRCPRGSIRRRALHGGFGGNILRVRGWVRFRDRRGDETPAQNHHHRRERRRS